jgi:hypothetical protein
VVLDKAAAVAGRAANGERGRAAERQRLLDLGQILSDEVLGD